MENPDLKRGIFTLVKAVIVSSIVLYIISTLILGGVGMYIDQDYSFAKIFRYMDGFYVIIPWAIASYTVIALLFMFLPYRYLVKKDALTKTKWFSLTLVISLIAVATTFNPLVFFALWAISLLFWRWEIKLFYQKEQD